MAKKIIISLFFVLVLVAVPASFSDVFPITITHINPETNEETIETYYVNLYDEITYTNIEYEHFIVEQTITLKPFEKYKPVYTPKTYTITYLDGPDKYIQEYTYGEDVTLRKPLEENHPYEISLGYFDFYGNKYSDIIEKPSGNVVLFSKYQGKKYNIIYDGKIEDSYIYGEGKTLKTPKKDGYKFLGWYLDGQKITVIDENAHGDISLVSKWSKITVSYPQHQKSSYWVVNYIVVNDYDDLVPKLDAGYVCYYMGNILLGHNPGVFSWMPRANVGELVLVNGQFYKITDKFMTEFSDPEYKGWYQPGDFALVTCYGGGLNRLIIVLEKAYLK